MGLPSLSVAPAGLDAGGVAPGGTVTTLPRFSHAPAAVPEPAPVV